MKYCSHCGTELSDEIEICTGCGCKVKNDENTTQPKVSKSKGSKMKVTVIVVSVVVAVVLAVSAVLFVPRNLKLDDFKETNAVTAIIKYGFTTDGSFDAPIYDDDRLKFYDVPVDWCQIDTKDNTVTMRFRNEHKKEVYKKIERYCVRDNNNSYSKVFRYDNLKITTDDGGYITIYIN